jgi:hypothetical protein
MPLDAQHGWRRDTMITARAYALIRIREMRVITLTAGVSPG